MTDSHSDTFIFCFLDSRFPHFQTSRFPDFQTLPVVPSAAPVPPDEISDPNLTPLPTHPGIKCVARSQEPLLRLPTFHCKTPLPTFAQGRKDVHTLVCPALAHQSVPPPVRPGTCSKCVICLEFCWQRAKVALRWIHAALCGLVVGCMKPDALG